MEQFKPYPDGGSLNATQSKYNEKSPDYFGEIALNLSDMTNIRVENGLHIVKLSGWKRVAKSGKTYLSLGVKRKEFEEPASAPTAQPAPKAEISDDDIPF
jgi:uncharacterized protein (DUF736 family)